MVAQGLTRAHLTQDDSGAESCCNGLQVIGVLHNAWIGDDDVQSQVRRVLIQNAQVVRARHAVCLPVLRRQIEHDGLQGRRALQCPPHGGQNQVGQDRGVPGAGTQDHPVGLANGSQCLRVGVRISGDDAHIRHLPAFGGYCHLTADPLLMGAIDEVRLDHQW